MRARDLMAALNEGLDEITSLVSASDTFKSLTIGAAEGLERSAAERKSLAANIGRDSEAHMKVEDGPSKQQLVDLSGRVEQQAEAQERLAAWLRRLAGGDA